MAGKPWPVEKYSQAGRPGEHALLDFENFGNFGNFGNFENFLNLGNFGNFWNF